MGAIESDAQAEASTAADASTDTQVKSVTFEVAEDAEPVAESSTAANKRLRLDLLVEASGFSRDLQMQLETVSDASSS